MLGQLLMSDHFSWKIFLEQTIKLALYLIDKTCMNEIVKLWVWFFKKLFTTSINLCQVWSGEIERLGLATHLEEFSFNKYLQRRLRRTISVFVQTVLNSGIVCFCHSDGESFTVSQSSQTSPNCTVLEIDSEQHWDPRYDNSILRRVNFQNHCYCLNLKA